VVRRDGHVGGFRRLERALAMQLDEDRSAAAGALLIGGEAHLAGQHLAGSGRAVEDAFGRAVAGLHQDASGPLLMAVIVFPCVDRAAADRRLVKGDLEQLEPAMSANHEPKISGSRPTAGKVERETGFEPATFSLGS
jgi:hypothetical protein